MAVGQNSVPKWVALVNGNLDYNLRSNSWFNLDPHPNETMVDTATFVGIYLESNRSRSSEWCEMDLVHIQRPICPSICLNLRNWAPAGLHGRGKGEAAAPPRAAARPAPAWAPAPRASDPGEVAKEPSGGVAKRLSKRTQKQRTAKTGKPIVIECVQMCFF